MITLLHGDDILERQRFLSEAFAGMGDPGMAELNTARLDGRQASEDELRTAATSLPFLAPRRLVSLSHPLARLGADAARKRFTQLLDNLPETTDLILVVEDTFLSKKKGWELLKENHWLRKWVAAAGPQRAVYRLCQLPSQDNMPRWVLHHAAALGGQFTPQAAAQLAAFTGNDTLLASHEVEKLLIYVNFQRPVEVEDVSELVTPAMHTNVFEMVESLAGGDTRGALRMLERLLEDQDPLYLFGALVRQYRLLLQTRELLEHGGTQVTVAAELGQLPFVAEKLIRQARRFSLAVLCGFYRSLAKTDLAIKTGQIEPRLAIELLVTELGGLAPATEQHSPAR